jgi:hypothetical protein
MGSMHVGEGGGIAKGSFNAELCPCAMWKTSDEKRGPRIVLYHCCRPKAESGKFGLSSILLQLVWRMNDDPMLIVELHVQFDLYSYTHGTDKNRRT